MFVGAEIVGRWVSNVVVLPRAVMRPGERFLIVDEQDRLRFREVEILRFEDDRVLVTAGMEAGDRVCVSALEAPVDGMKVRVARTENSSTGTSNTGDSPAE
jgi:multidrug efflux pump subunit AcrA (membrane-fusion protein)